MMHFLRMTTVHMKRILHSPTQVLVLAVMPIAIIALIQFGTGTATSTDRSTVLVLGENPKVEEELRALDLVNLYEGSSDTAIAAVESGRINRLYILPEKFGTSGAEDRPIEVYSRGQTSTDSVFENFLRGLFLDSRLEEYLVQEGLDEAISIYQRDNGAVSLVVEGQKMDDQYFFALVMILVFMLMNSNQLSDELITMKETHVLTRFISAPNSDLFTISTIVVAYWVLLVIINTLSLFLAKLLLKFEMANPVLAVVTIASMCFLSVCMSLAIFRLVKNKTLASMIPIFVSILSMIVMMASEIGRFENPAIAAISKLSPYYWAMEAIDKNQILPGIPILLLMGIVFLTAGSFRLREYAKP
ncbi:MAG: ABC transporter permease [Tissierellia bacterium]|nr:ABC transporter permease [Tissierellia bacterium]